MAESNCNVVNGGPGNVKGITSEYLYDIYHRLVDQIAVSGPASLGYSRANIYAGGEYLGEDAPDSLVKTPSATASMLRITDQAGSLRSRWDLAGNMVTECTSFPYGEGYSCAGATPPTLYTGKDRDPETGFDYFGARYYSSSMGRFTSPDNGEDQDTKNPQSWNLYSYGRNSPLAGRDDDGRVYHVCDQYGQNCSDQSDAQFDVNMQNASADGERYSNGNIYFSNGTLAGTYQQTDVDIPGDATSNVQAANMIGNGGMGAIKDFAIGSAAGGLIGGAALTAAGTDAGLSILTENLEGVLSRAASTVGNQGAKVASREVAEEAAKKWVGEGARELTDRGTGKVIGEISADGTKIARFTSAETKGYINLVDKLTGSNLHVGW